MKNNRKNRFNANIIVVILAVLCIGGIGLSLFKGFSANTGRSLVSSVLAPMQEGINSLGSLASDFSEKKKTINDLESENEELQSQIEVLQNQITSMQNNQSEYDDLLSLLDLKEKYPSYDMTAARIISKDSSNWYDTFTINKGSNQGIAVDMNVISGNGLVGIVTEVSPTTATVRSIIDDVSAVSGMISNSLDVCIVSGNLTNIDSGLLNVELISKEAAVMNGDEVVTSYISEKYLPGLLIGYISDITTDESDLTYNAKLTPVVDFQHLDNVLVIKTLKSEFTDDSSQEEEDFETETEETEETETSAEE